ncbi:hypothetical protein MRX96_011111 [Rhipicephalus microplus]
MEREILFGDRLHLPSGGGGSSCEVELLKLLRDVDLAVLEKHRRWKTRLADAEDALERREAELTRTKQDLATSREGRCRNCGTASRTSRRCRPIWWPNMTGRIGELKEDSRGARAASSEAADFWRNRAVELEKEVASLRERACRDDRAARSGSTASRERDLERVVSEKDGVIDRLTDKVTQLTKRLRQVENASAAATTPATAAAVGSWDSPDLVEEYLRTCRDDKAQKNAAELRTKIERHMQEFTARMEQDKRTL